MCYACGHGVLKGLWSACSASQAKLISGIPKARELVVRMVLSKDYGGTMAAAVAFGVAALTAGLGVWYRCIGGGRQDAACAVHRAAGDKMCRVRVPQLCACTLSRRRRHHFRPQCPPRAPSYGPPCRLRPFAG